MEYESASFLIITEVYFEYDRVICYSFEFSKSFSIKHMH